MKKHLTTACLFVVTAVAIASFSAPFVSAQETNQSDSGDVPPVHGLRIIYQGGSSDINFVDPRLSAQRLFDRASAQGTVQPSDTSADSSAARYLGSFFGPESWSRFNCRCGIHNDTSQFGKNHSTI